MYFSSAGEKIFDVEIGGEQILKDIDIFGKVGKATALDEYIPIEIKNDKLLFNGKAVDQSGYDSTKKIIKIKHEITQHECRNCGQIIEKDKEIQSIFRN